MLQTQLLTISCYSDTYDLIFITTF